MQIDIKGRNVPVTDELRARLERRCRKVSRQVSEFARLEVEIYEERNPSIADRQVAEATLYLKGVTLRARDASPRDGSLAEARLRWSSRARSSAIATSAARSRAGRTAPSIEALGSGLA